MANTPTCDRCGHVSKPGELPPSVGPCEFRFPVEHFAGDLCLKCQKLVLEQIAGFLRPGPGGVLKGKEMGPYLVKP